MVVPLFIAGNDVRNQTNLIFNVDSPFEDNVLYKAQGASVQDANDAVQSSHSAFQVWKKSSYQEKRDLLTKVADGIQKKTTFFMKLLKDMGLPQWFAEFNVKTSIDILKDLAAIVSLPVGIIPSDSKGAFCNVINEPLGPILSIAPWNAPMILCIRSIAGPVAAGCSVVLKTSEHSPLIHYELAKIFNESGAPKGLVNTINHRPSDAGIITEAIITNKYIKKINFTGSSKVGKIIATSAAKVLKPVLLELGGKCAVIVSSNADLEKAAENTILGGFAHNGQICMSTERVYVLESVYDKFLEQILLVASKYVEKTEFLPQRSITIAQRIENMLNNAISNGAILLFGQISRKNAFIRPTILTNVPDDDPIYDEETFGPTFFISKVNTIEEAILKVNSSRYGLSSSVWSTDLYEGIKIARSIECGAVHINGKTVHDEPVLPHGGVKESGFGRFNNIWGVQEFQYTKTITFGK